MVISAALCRVSIGRQFPNALRPVARQLWMERMMAAAGVDVSAAQDNDAWLLPIPATLIVGRDGVIRRMGFEDMLAALRCAP
jgi:hypothetical protein